MRTLALVSMFAAATAHAQPDGAPPGHTGGFGEPSCHACHFDGPLQIAVDTVRLDGMPARFKAGETYELVVTVDQPSPAAGFQLSARDSVGRQAGTLAPADDTTQVTDDGGTTYIGHTADGIYSGGRWTVIWQAPREARQVLFNIAVTSANDDRSEFGDQVKIFETLTTMERAR